MKAAFFGLIQGLTEFLPISSSGHLSILNRVMSVDKNILPFMVFLHIATLCAIFIFFWKEIISAATNLKLILNIIIITAITAVIALSVKHFLGENMNNKYLVSVCFLINAIILLSIRKCLGKKTYTKITVKDSLILGILQGVAAFPGISRSGITISGSLKRGFEPKEAFALSFLMAIPAILGAFIIELKDIRAMNIPIQQSILGFVIALISGLFTLWLVKKTLINRKFGNFGYYCLLIFVASLII